MNPEVCTTLDPHMPYRGHGRTRFLLERGFAGSELGMHAL